MRAKPRLRDTSPPLHEGPPSVLGRRVPALIRLESISVMRLIRLYRPLAASVQVENSDPVEKVEFLLAHPSLLS